MNRLQSLGADLVGVYVDSLSAADACRIGQACKEVGALTIAGGPLATLRPESLADHFDVVFRGEAEIRFPRVAATLLEEKDTAPLRAIPGLVFRSRDGDLTDTGSEWELPSLDDLPFPAWDILDMDRYIDLWPYLDATNGKVRGTGLIGSRGCPWKCSYCQPALNSIFGGRMRRRSVDSIIEEIRRLQERYDIGGYFFHDDTLTADRKWLTHLCERLAGLERRIQWGCNSRVDLLDDAVISMMAESGLKTVHLGIESGSARIRTEILAKRLGEEKIRQVVNSLDRSRVSSLGFFMLGSPTEALGEMLSTLRLAWSLKLREATFSLVSVLPETQLAGLVLHHPKTRIKSLHAIDYYRSRNFVDESVRYSGRAVRFLQVAGMIVFYLSPRRASYLLRHLTTGVGVRRLFMKLARFSNPIRLLSRAHENARWERETARDA